MFNDFRFTPNYEHRSKTVRELVDLLQQTSPSVLFHPAWSIPSSHELRTDINCQQRHIFAAVDPPIVAAAWNNSVLDHLRIQSCVPRYSSFHIIYKLLVFRFLDSMALEPYDLHSIYSASQFGFPYERLPKRLEPKFQEFWQKNLPRLESDDESWTLGLLKYYYLEAYAMYRGEQDKDASTAVELYAAQLLSSFFSECLSTAVGLTMAETSYKRLNGDHAVDTASKASLIGRAVGESSLQFNVLFMLIFYPAIFFALRGLFAQRKLLRNQAESGLPWSIGSIASKAALLCRCRLSAPLANARTVPSDLYSQPDVLIGHFASKDDHQSYFWRLDSLSKNVTSRLHRSFQRAFTDSE